jgi:hypothetical protein
VAIEKTLGAGGAMAAQALFKLGRFAEVIKLAGHYPGDLMPDTLYGRALALFKLGMRKRADNALMKAIDILPLVRKELLKKRHRLPRTARPGFVTIGGPDEAYYYWQQWGIFWQADPEALKWLKECYT